MRSNEKKRGSSPGMPKDETPLRDPKQALHQLEGLPKLETLLQWKLWHCAKPMSM
jgi:hypothetical protein